MLSCSACDMLNDIFGGKSGVHKEYYENCAVFTFDNFDSKISINVDRIGLDEGESGGWLLSLYSLICIFVSSRVIDYVIDGASYDKLLFIISNENEKLRQFIIHDMERGATILKASGMYTKEDKEMIFLVVSRREVALVQRKVKAIDPKAFLVVTDAYDTYGEGFKSFPEGDTILNE